MHKGYVPKGDAGWPVTAFYNENDPKAAAWLRELVAHGHISPGVVDERDIRDIRPADLSGFAQCHFFADIGVWSYALRRAGWPDDRPVWTGSCPCQPFSAAGKGGGFDDERHLWPAWFWLIEQCRPAIVFGEQVASKDAEPWIDLVQDDMEAVGYCVGAVPFPAAGIGAPHIRDRLYWVADAGSAGLSLGSIADDGRGTVRDEGPTAPPSELSRELADAVEGGRARLSGRSQEGTAEHRDTGGLGFSGSGGPSQGREAAAPDRHGHSPVAASGGHPTGPTSGLWRDADWLLCRDGFWRPVEPGTFPLVASVAKGMGRGSDPSAPIDPVSAEARVMRLRGYGNAINAEAAVAFIGSYLEVWETGGAEIVRDGYSRESRTYDLSKTYVLAVVSDVPETAVQPDEAAV